jgi:hypothetical protein
MQEAKEMAFFRRQYLRFLISLGEIEFDTLTTPEHPGDLLNLADRLISFGLTSEYRPELPRSLAQWHDASERFAKQIQKDPHGTLGLLLEETKKLLAATADRDSYDVPIPTGSVLEFNAKFMDRLQAIERSFGQKISPALSARVFNLRVPQSHPDRLTAVFLFHAMEQLNSEQGMMIRRCARTGCRRIFLAERPKQIYCSRRCASAATVEAYKQKIGEEKFKERHRAAARKNWRSAGAKRKRSRCKGNGK